MNVIEVEPMTKELERFRLPSSAVGFNSHTNKTT
jgi:hypothetical protein